MPPGVPRRHVRDTATEAENVKTAAATVTPAMPKTVQVDDATYEALKSYKVAGLTFDQVIRRLMERQDPEAFHREYRAWQKRVLANMKKSGDFEPL